MKDCAKPLLRDLARKTYPGQVIVRAMKAICYGIHCMMVCIFPRNQIALASADAHIT